MPFNSKEKYDAWRAANKGEFAAKMRQWRKDNREEWLAWRKENYKRWWAELPPDKRADIQAKRKAYYQRPEQKRKAAYRLKSKTFGLTPDEYDSMLIAQSGRCGICWRQFSKSQNDPSVDHCHKSQKVRMLLCGQCNAGLGNFRDSPAALRAAADYLESYNP